jgi:hypothetical protein
MTSMNFEQVTATEFAALVSTKPASNAFKKQYARFLPSIYDGYDGPDYMVHRGPLQVSGNFVAPGLVTLIVGDLTVDGLVDLNNPAEKGFDEGGVFVVLGNVTCRAFAGHYGKCSFVDGDLRADDIIVNDFSDSALVVIKNLRTKFFLGSDIWAEVGGDAEMAYGNGYCLPVGYKNAAEQAIQPDHDGDDSMDMLNVADPYDMNVELMQRLRKSEPIFKS